MPSSIPYDPSLALANILHPDKLKLLESISAAQEPADAAQDNLESLITTERSLSMTAQELINMNVDEKTIGDLNKQLETVKKDIGSAATAYATAKIKSEAEIVKIRNSGKSSTKSEISDSVESPVDYTRTQIKSMPLSADSVKLDVQYFSFDSNSQTANQHASSIAAYVSGQTQGIGYKASAQMSGSVQEQASHNAQQHDIQGTLVITATCTHKNAVVLAPCVIDVDKGISAWNSYYPDAMIKMDDPATVSQIAAQDATKKESVMNILSGVTYGSSFVGMAHILNDSSTVSDQEMFSTAESLQASMKVGSWFESYEGGFGVNSSFSNSAKSLLSQQNVSAHVDVICMGLIPSIKSNQVQQTVQGFTDNSAAMMDQLAALQNATADQQNSLTSAANAARTGGNLEAIKTSNIKSAISAVGQIDKGANSVLDTDSLMTAFEDYVKQAAEGKAGVPITYYLKPISRADLAKMWVMKYYPELWPPKGSKSSGSEGGE